VNWVKCIRNRLLRAARREDGITLIETVLAIVIFSIVSVSIIGVVTSATAADGASRQKTIALELAQQQVEYIRQLSYPSAATVGGNPAPPAGQGVEPTQSKRVMGLWYTLTTTIRYVNDPIPGSGVIATYANYKQVSVVVTRKGDSKQLARVVTYLTNPSRQNLGGINNAIINVTAKDYGMPGQTNLGGVAINLSNETIGYNASDTTDTATGAPTFGQVTFPALQADSGTTSVGVYSVLATFPGYVTLREDLPSTTGSPALVQLDAAETVPVTLRLYKPCSIYVHVIDEATNDLYTGAATVTISYSRPTQAGSEEFSLPQAGSPNGVLQLPAPATLDGDPIAPGTGYSISVDTPDHRHVDLEGLTVAEGYQSGTLSSTFELRLPTTPVVQDATLTVIVNHGRYLSDSTCASGDHVAYAKVTITSIDISPRYLQTLYTPTSPSANTGRVDFVGIPFGTYNVSVSKEVDRWHSYTGGPTGLPVAGDTSICVPLRYS